MFEAIRQRLKGWKTILIATFWGLTTVAGWFLEQIQGVDLSPILPEKYRPLWPVAIAMSMILLRFVTTGPIGTKHDPGRDAS